MSSTTRARCILCMGSFGAKGTSGTGYSRLP